jgi:hypothetical protein
VGIWERIHADWNRDERVNAFSFDMSLYYHTMYDIPFDKALNKNATVIAALLIPSPDVSHHLSHMRLRLAC